MDDELTERMVLDAIREAKRQIAEEEERARTARHRWTMVAVWTVAVIATVTILLIIDAGNLTRSTP